MMPEPCRTCKYNETWGEMVEPCFRCLNTVCIFTGEKKRLFSEWTDAKLSWQQIDDWCKKEQQDFEDWVNSDPETKRILSEMVAIFSEK